MTHGEGDDVPAWPADRAVPRPGPDDDRSPWTPLDGATATRPPIPMPRMPADGPTPVILPPPPTPVIPPARHVPPSPYARPAPPQYAPPQYAPPQYAPPQYAPPPPYGPPGQAPPPYAPPPGGAPPGVPPQWAPPPWAPPHPVEPPNHRKLALRIVGVFAALIVLCGTPTVWAFVKFAPSLVETTAGPDGNRTTATAGPTASVRSPQPGDPESVRVRWMRAQIDIALASQAASLLKGDEKGFLAAGVAGNAAVRGKLTTRYRSLRALQVTKWTAAVAVAPDHVVGTGAAGEWAVRLSVKHCFVLPTCVEEDLRLDSRWVERAGKAYLLDLAPAPESQNGPRPWELSELRAVVGKRVVMATTPKYASRLSSLLSEAEKAAAVADRFAIVTPPPDRYRVYFAGTAEWKAWYGGDRPDWAAGYAVPTSQQRIDVVLNAAETPSNFLDDILRHEMSHVASLRGAKHQGTENWWLVEGLAEIAELNGRAATQHDAVAAGAVRSFIRTGKWNGKVAVSEPADSAALKEAGARYGIAFLAMRRLVDKYGEKKLIAYFKAVVHDGDTPATASTAVFGAQWTAVEADCVSYIRRTAG